ncbi:TadE-like protein [Sphingobium faniae]|nr:TadE-like protein [Sphingobium faniae]
MRRLFHRLRVDRAGVTIMEFALIAPVFLTMILGALDLAHSLYMQSVLEGVLQKAARDSSLESGTEAANQLAIDERITQQVHHLANNASVDIQRRSFYSYSKAAEARAEAFQDNNDNGRCDAGEPFEDNNANGVRDADGGNSGQGGTQDAVILTVDVDYPRLFPVHGLIGLPSTVRLNAKTVLTNQPYGQKPGEPVPVLGHCP